MSPRVENIEIVPPRSTPILSAFPHLLDPSETDDKANTEKID